MSQMPAALINPAQAARRTAWPASFHAQGALRREAMLAALPGAHYRYALEVGCGDGLLTQALAPRCDRLLAIDQAQAALGQAEARLRHMRHVRLACHRFPGDLQADAAQEGFDLMLLPDVLHGLDNKAMAQAARLTRSLMTRGGHVQLIHAFHMPGCSQTGEDAAERFIAALRSVAPVLLQVRTADYRIDVLQL